MWRQVYYCLNLLQFPVWPRPGLRLAGDPDEPRPCGPAPSASTVVRMIRCQRTSDGTPSEYGRFSGYSLKAWPGSTLHCVHVYTNLDLLSSAWRGERAEPQARGQMVMRG